MSRRAPLIAALAVTALVCMAWLATGRELFTQQSRFVTIERAADPDDFLELAQADDDGMIRETQRQDGFWFGLLPSDYPRPGAWTPQIAWMSATTIAAPVWLIAAGVSMWRRLALRNSSPARGADRA